MHFELKDISESGVRQEYSCRVEDFPELLTLQEQEDLCFTDLLAFQLRLQKSGQIVEVDGLFTTRVALTCGHCLQNFEQQIASEFSLTYTPLQASPSADEDAEEVEVELDTDELGLVYYKNDTLELSHPLQEQVVMSLPIAPLCSANCKGLCPVCGCDLNKKSCHCEKKTFNNRFSALAGLKLDTSD